MPRVMVVEDEEPLRRLVTRVLQRDGYDVVVHQDAADALGDAHLEGVELILTDLNMPTPGERLIEEVRRRGAQTPIVVMSGHLSEEKLRVLEALGAQATLAKPFGMPDLLQAVHQHASDRSASASHSA